ncbi:NUDIX domain-containing protein [Gracilimonas sp.]|uniref:NUDIX hydrolase n=1 Tax=Gracilimonas sp. TaxID=1974203 RepID=UPI0032F03BB9
MSDYKPEPIKAAGGVVLRFIADSIIPEVLMIYRNGYWDLPKGKLEEGESIEMCAVREVAEEVGSSLPAIVSTIGTSYHEYPEKGKTMGKTTWWYSMIFTRPETFIPQEKEGIEQVEWVLLPEAIEKAGFENLKEILRSLTQ